MRANLRWLQHCVGEFLLVRAACKTNNSLMGGELQKWSPVKLKEMNEPKSSFQSIDVYMQWVQGRGDRWKIARSVFTCVYHYLFKEPESSTLLEQAFIIIT